ncbi:DUF948 domain-containing protein [Secundilactobacillus paracollinoides]|uniref:Chemotaxis protein n=1 Tax=Secundilactobacillus paracollinoides TaxID=240427 RepID=A0A1B2J1L0_9LACO|nr:DUF948 domain-containing protein [Secundilactobacillus paracollinoides]ANZ62287.1 chemotaxis protein [Secundilactobacillus paracollinoides]ANZ68236.1 chemotaxis protein [Secundilactobacillus paracollinoides]KRL77773.1 methyl-accepting chemotaxis-like protein [Secundilactobacillus paracollinoides DSM 15502 = JCM 11969]
MTGGQVAGMIAAVAFLILVLFIGMFLSKMLTTLKEVNRSIQTLTDDVDVVSKQAEDIMANANTLLEDVNKKVATVDPVFQAAADLGTSVSDLNDATRNLTSKVSKSAKKTASTNILVRTGEAAFNFYTKHRRSNSDD